MLFRDPRPLLITPLRNGLSKKLWMIFISRKRFFGRINLEKLGSLIRILTLDFSMSLLLSKEELPLIFSNCPREHRLLTGLILGTGSPLILPPSLPPQIHPVLMNIYPSLRTSFPLMKMLFFVPFLLNWKSLMPFSVLDLQKLLAQMDLQLCFTRNIGVLLKMLFFAVFGIFFSKNHFLKEQNHTFIALVPKQLGPSSVNHFTPISLCNIIYKIISKILANRYKLLLHHFISPLQFAFVPFRNIQDNSILAQELLHTLEKKKKGRGGLMAIKIDMEKAFDHMERNFLFANWIRICITSPSFSILINGSPYGHFTPARSLWQGDLLSPFLFILGTEVFSRLLQRQFSLGLLKGIKMARTCLPITHLLFSDNLLIFGKATSSEASTIKNCLDSYC
jgi:hypothetical protein